VLLKSRKFSVKFTSGSFVSFVGCFRSIKHSKVVMLPVSADLRPPSTVPFSNTLEARCVLFGFLLIKKVLTVGCISYLSIIERISGRMVNVGGWPRTVFVKVNNAVKEILSAIYVDVSIAVCVGVTGDFPNLTVTALLRSPLTTPSQGSIFLIKVKNASDKLCGEVVSISHRSVLS